LRNLVLLSRCSSWTFSTRSISRRWTLACCRRTSCQGSSFVLSVACALNASIPPYVTEYFGCFSPRRMSGKCFNASSSHAVTWAMISLTDQRPVTPGMSNSASISLDKSSGIQTRLARVDVKAFASYSLPFTSHLMF